MLDAKTTAVSDVWSSSDPPIAPGGDNRSLSPGCHLTLLGQTVIPRNSVWMHGGDPESGT